MVVISFFDGMSGGRIALEYAGVPVTEYYAFEIDKYAIQVSKANWPEIKHRGDVRGAIACAYPKPDLIIGGSPCQGFSFAGKQLNFDDPRSALFFEFVRFLREAQEENPDVYFLLENVVMKQEYQDVISEALGVKPIKLNSALVSAQNRKRLYWTNIPYFGPPEDKGILLKHILIDGNPSHLSESEMQYMERNSPKWSNGKKRLDIYNNDLEAKALCLTANMYKGVPYGVIKKPEGIKQIGNLYENNPQCGRIYSDEGKSPTLRARSGGMAEPYVGIEPRDKSQTILSTIHKENVKSMVQRKKFGLMAPDTTEALHYRKLTVTECEHLMNVPPGYTQRLSAAAKQISNTQAYKMLGNGWECRTLAHLFAPLVLLDLL